MLLVLLGNAGKVRKILSIILFSFIILLYTIGTFSLYSGDSLIDGFRLTKEYTLIDIDDNDMFKLPSLPQKWKMRSKDSYSDENQYVDLWLVDPFKDSHIMIIYESFDYMHGIEHQTLIENILNNAKAVGEIDVLNEDRDIYNGFDRTKMQVSSILDGIPFAYYYSIMSDDTDIIQIICFTYEEKYKFSENEFGKFVNEFYSRPITGNTNRS